MHCYIMCTPPSFSLKNRLLRMHNFIARRVTHTRKKGTYNTSFAPAALSSCTFQMTVQNPVYNIQSTEWNDPSVPKRSD